MEKHFDYLFAGAGLAGLTMACELSRRPAFSGKKIGLIDRSEKLLNDRTWCSWATDEELPALLQTGILPHKTWGNLFFHGKKSRELAIEPYRYHLVRGIDFYENARRQLAKNPNVELFFTDIKSVDEATGAVETALGNLTGEVVFNSFFEVEKLGLPAGSTNLWQHFKGLLVETEAPVFDPLAATFMDFRAGQGGEARFFYVLPFSEKRALVEFTVFGKEVYGQEFYDCELEGYLRNSLKINGFKIIETEFGVIPMTDFSFQAQKGPARAIPIGTTAGWVKPSSGYAFKRVQEKSRHLVDHFEKTGRWDLRAARSPWLFRLFDAIFLEVLRSGRAGGAAIFEAMFSKLPAPLVFKFLDEKTGPLETLRALFSCPVGPFLRSFFAVLPRVFKI